MLVLSSHGGDYAFPRSVVRRDPACKPSKRQSWGPEFLSCFCWLDLPFNPDDISDMFFPKARPFPNYRVLQPRRLYSSWMVWMLRETHVVLHVNCPLLLSDFKQSEISRHFVCHKLDYSVSNSRMRHCSKRAMEILIQDSRWPATHSNKTFPPDRKSSPDLSKTKRYENPFSGSRAVTDGQTW